MASVTLQLDAATRAQMKASYADYLLDPVPHSEFRAQVDGVTLQPMPVARSSSRARMSKLR